MYLTIMRMTTFSNRGVLVEITEFLAFDESERFATRQVVVSNRVVAHVGVKRTRVVQNIVESGIGQG